MNIWTGHAYACTVSALRVAFAAVAICVREKSVRDTCQYVGRDVIKVDNSRSSIERLHEGSR